MKTERLEKLGFTGTEAKVYLALVAAGTAKPTQISKKTDVHRVTVFDALERLVQKAAGRPDERTAVEIFLIARHVADDDRRGRRAVPGVAPIQSLRNYCW